jgi:hypothetical protein
MKKYVLPFLGIVILFCSCTKQNSAETQVDGSLPVAKEAIKRKVNSYPDFCTSSCSNFVGYIPEGDGSAGVMTWGNFHLWINQPLSYDVMITVENRIGGTAYFTQWGQQFFIPAGENNSTSISGYQEASFLCTGYNQVSAQITKNYTVHIVSIDRVDNATNLNAQYQLWPGSGSLTVSDYCIGTGGGGKDGGGGGL